MKKKLNSWNKLFIFDAESGKEMIDRKRKKK
jgi:hypothetical protein